MTDQTELNSMASSVYDDDDEPQGSQPAHEGGNGVLIMNTQCEYEAIPYGEDREGFAVMVTVKAPALAPMASRRAGLDLVAVLDVSGGMVAGDKLAHLKRAMGFVIDRLRPRDRLSVVAFSDAAARRVTRLTRMCEHGKAAARRAVDALDVTAGGATSGVRAGLDEAAKVLDGSRHHNVVTGVILVSGGGHGDDRCSASTTTGGDDDSSCAVVPPFFLSDQRGWGRTPVHAFAFGAGHDAAAMYSVSEATGGTFSFVENDAAAIQDALARCVGGLLSVTAQFVEIEVECWCLGVRVREVRSGRYEWGMDGDRREAWVSVGKLYAEEERRVLLLLDVPADATYLFKPRCRYMDMATGHELDVDLTTIYAQVERPDEATDVAPCMEVKRELLRVDAARDMASARAAAESGDHAEAARILDASREMVSRSAPAMASDAVCAALVDELDELSRRVSDEREYRETGRACLLAAMSAHAQQRGFSAVRLSRSLEGAGQHQIGCASGAIFATPAMRKMEKLSEMMRRRQQQQQPALPPLLVNRSKAAVLPCSRLEARLALAVPRLSVLRRYRRLLLKR